MCNNGGNISIKKLFSLCLFPCSKYVIVKRNIFQILFAPNNKHLINNWRVNLGETRQTKQLVKWLLACLALRGQKHLLEDPQEQLVCCILRRILKICSKSKNLETFFPPLTKFKVFLFQQLKLLQHHLQNSSVRLRIEKIKKDPASRKPLIIT